LSARMVLRFQLLSSIVMEEDSIYMIVTEWHLQSDSQIFTVVRWTLLYELAKAQLPMSLLTTSAWGLMSKSKISIGRPMVVQLFGISTMPAT